MVTDLVEDRQLLAAAALDSVQRVGAQALCVVGRRQLLPPALEDDVEHVLLLKREVVVVPLGQGEQLVAPAAGSSQAQVERRLRLTGALGVVPSMTAMSFEYLTSLGWALCPAKHWRGMAGSYGGDEPGSEDVQVEHHHARIEVVAAIAALLPLRLEPVVLHQVPGPGIAEVQHGGQDGLLLLLPPAGLLP